MAEAEFVAFLLEQLRPLGAVRARRMFGGYGVYRGAQMFALVADGVLYLKTDEGNRAEFEAADQRPFVYETKAGRRTAMSYFTAPEESIEDSEQLLRWAQSALAAARRATAASPRQKKKAVSDRGAKKSAARGLNQRKKKAKTTARKPRRNPS
ncbi:MAG: TfoX/Sxy family protein [Leptospirales bacterium]|nr:TfoX/Sxy family protein [Leptospirales bacterium]